MVWLSSTSLHLSLRFGGLTVLDDVSFSVAAGELFALIGPNGAGKTSVLNCISGIYRGSGAIRFRGEDIAGRAPHEIARLGLARTFQHGELFPQMSVLDNLLTGRHARIRTNPLAEMLFLPACGARRSRTARRSSASSSSSSSSAIATPPSAACRSACRRSSALPARWRWSPSLMLLDEPSAGLNREEREDLARFILRIKHELSMTMIWIEHDMQMVADLADRIHVLDYGRTIAEGAPERVLDDPNVLAAYLGVEA